MVDQRPPGLEPGERSGTAGIVLRLLATVLLVVLAVPAAVLLLLVMGSLLGGAEMDPHGYTILFGTFLLIPLLPMMALVAPFTLAPRHRLTCLLISFPLALLVIALLIAGLLSAD